MKKAILYIFIILLSTQCAQITPLTGGKKDTTPPKALVFLPNNASINFNQKNIEIQFNEFIALKDLTNQFIITPQTKQLPEIQAVGKKLKIEFKDPLLPNTTYKLSFGNSIVDIKESNVLSNFEYVFSTGPTIDSLKIIGNVVNDQTNKPLSNILVGLYSLGLEDSIIYKQKPLYVSKTNAEGNFTFNYLPSSKFNLVAINDVNKNLMYDGFIEEIGFNSESINTNDTNSISVRLFKEVPSKQFIKKSISPEYGKAIIIYNKACGEIETLKAKGLLSYFQNTAKDSLILYYNNVFDTLYTIIKYKENRIDTAIIRVASEDTYTKLKKANSLKYTIRSNFNNSFPFYEILKFELNMPFDITKVNMADITFFETKDSIKSLKQFKILKDEKKPNGYSIEAKIKENTKYSITFNKGAFSDLVNRKNDSTTFTFNTNSTEDYGKLNLKLTFPKKENYLVYLLNESGEIVKFNEIGFSLTSSSDKLFEYINLKAGNYFIKVVEDANKNKRFDAGNYYLKQQSEIIYYNNSPIKILSGWEIENEWRVK